MTRKILIAGFVTATLISACQLPKIQIVAPDKPIEINLTVKIDQQVRVRLDKDVEELIADNPDLF